jgi:hypothetical protein
LRAIEEQIMLTKSKIALTALLAASMTFGMLNVASAKPKRVQPQSRVLQTAPVYLGPGVISGYRNTPENWVPPPRTGGGVG